MNLDPKKTFSRSSRVIFFFIFCGFCLYGNTFSNQMFWDDYDNILNNRYIKDWQYFGKYFSENLVAGAGFLSNYWRPLLLFVFSVEWKIWQDWSPGYHFVNISFHIANVILLFFILFRLFNKRWVAFFVSLIFLIHPLQTEAVTYVSGLGDSLSVFFIFLGILFYLKFRVSQIPIKKSHLYFLSILMYPLALLSKESAIIMPALIFLVDFFRQKEKLKEILKNILPFFILAGGYLLLRATVLNFVNVFNFYNEDNIFTQNFHIRAFTFFKVLTIYFGLLLWPIPLHMERTVQIPTFFFLPSVLVGAVVFFALLTLALIKFKKWPIFSFGTFWFFIALFPFSNLAVSIVGLLYEHWLYLPLIGIFLILAWLEMKIIARYHLQKVFLGFLLIFLIFLSVLTIKRNADWKDPITFYSQTLKYAPESYRVINNLGMAYADKKNHEAAERLYKRAIDLDPKNPVAYHNLANTYGETNKKDLAIENYKIAIGLNPQFLFSYGNLANLYLEGKNYQEAKKVLEQLLNYTEGRVDVLLVLARISVEEKSFKEAQGYLEKALQISPENIIIKSFLEDVKNQIQSQK